MSVCTLGSSCSVPGRTNGNAQVSCTPSSSFHSICLAHGERQDGHGCPCSCCLSRELKECMGIEMCESGPLVAWEQCVYWDTVHGRWAHTGGQRPVLSWRLNGIVNGREQRWHGREFCRTERTCIGSNHEATFIFRVRVQWPLSFVCIWHNRRLSTLGLGPVADDLLADPVFWLVIKAGLGWVIGHGTSVTAWPLAGNPDFFLFRGSLLTNTFMAPFPPVPREIPHPECCSYVQTECLPFIAVTQNGICQALAVLVFNILNE